MTTQYLVLAALLGSPNWSVRDQATKSLSYADASALPVVERLMRHPDPEIVYRASLARPHVLRRAAEAYIRAPGWMTIDEAKWWMRSDRFGHLDRAARAGRGRYSETSYPYMKKPEESVRAFVNFMKSQTSPRPLAWITPWEDMVNPKRAW